MKKLLTILLLLTFGICSGQNLVPNGDFEQYWHCPTNFGQIDSTKFWFQPTMGSSDYYNQCGTNAANIPNTWIGFQQAHSGAGFVGIHRYNDNPTAIYREYIEVQLSSSLASNVCYHFEMYFNLGNYCRFTSCSIGAYFSDTIITGVNNNVNLPYTPQINNTFINRPDTLNWKLVSGDFIASGGENYLIIGNFNDELSTDTATVNTNSLFYNSYVFIDDVTLHPCIIEGIDDKNKNITTIYPNPIEDNLNVQINNNEPTEIILYDLSSRKLLQQSFTNTTTINAEQLAKGMYLYEVRNKNGIIKNGKVIKE